MKIADFRLQTLIRLSLKTWPLLREPLDLLSLVTQRRILFSISEVTLRLLLIAVAFCMSQGVHPFVPWLQIPAEGSGLKHIYTNNCSAPSHFSALVDSIAVFFPFLVDPTKPHGQRGQPRQTCGGGDSGGEHVGELAPLTHEVRSTSSVHDDELF